MVGGVTGALGCVQSSVGGVGDHLVLFRESVDPPCLGIYPGGHVIADAQLSWDSCRRRESDRADEQDDLHRTTVLTEWSPDFGIVRFYTTHSATILLVDSPAAIMLMRRARAANQAALACPSRADRFDAPEVRGTCARSFHLGGWRDIDRGVYTEVTRGWITPHCL